MTLRNLLPDPNINTYTISLMSFDVLKVPKVNARYVKWLFHKAVLKVPKVNARYVKRLGHKAVQCVPNHPKRILNAQLQLNHYPLIISIDI